MAVWAVEDSAEHAATFRRNLKQFPGSEEAQNIPQS